MRSGWLCENFCNGFKAARRAAVAANTARPLALHERDVLLAQGREHPTDDDTTFYATVYGLFIAAAVAPLFGDQVQEKLMLGGDGGGIFDVESRGAATLDVTRMVTAGPPAAQVTDALAGRSADGADIVDFFAGLDLLPPGLTDARTWPRPAGPGDIDPGATAGQATVLCGVGRKPVRQGPTATARSAPPDRSTTPES